MHERPRQKRKSEIDRGHTSSYISITVFDDPGILVDLDSTVHDPA